MLEQHPGYLTVVNGAVFHWTHQQLEGARAYVEMEPGSTLVDLSKVRWGHDIHIQRTT